MALDASYQGYVAHRETENHACIDLSRHNQQGASHPAFTNSQAWGHTD